MTGVNLILLILFICLSIGIIGVSFMIRKKFLENSPNFISRILLGLLIGFSLFIVIFMPSITLYGLILWIHSFNSHFVSFDSPLDLFTFSLMVSILAFIYMFFFVLLLKLAIIKYNFKPMFGLIAEFILEFLALYLSLSFISSEVLHTIDLSISGMITITALFTIIYSGLDNLMDQIEKIQRKLAC